MSTRNRYRIKFTNLLNLNIGIRFFDGAEMYGYLVRCKDVPKKFTLLPLNGGQPLNFRKSHVDAILYKNSDVIVKKHHIDFKE